MEEIWQAPVSGSGQRRKDDSLVHAEGRQDGTARSHPPPQVT